MAWSVPLTAVSNAALTSAQWNASVRDNLLETAPAKATAYPAHFVSTGPNAIAERKIVEIAVDTTEGFTSVTFADLTTSGPTATVTCTGALVWINAQQNNSGTGQTYTSFMVSGASSVAANDLRSIVTDNTATTSIRAGVGNLVNLTTGSNIFTVQYRVSSGTGSWSRRRMQVMGL